MPPVKFSKTRKAMQKPFTPAQTRTIKKMATQVVRRNADHRQKYVHISTTQYLHQNTYVFNPMRSISLGTGGNERIGTEVNLTGLLINFRCTSIADQGTYRIRVYREVTDSIPTSTSPTLIQQGSMVDAGYTENTVDVSTATNDKFTIKVLKDKVVPINNNEASLSKIQVHRVWIPLREKFVYNNDGYSRGENLYFSVSAQTPGGMANSTAVVNVNIGYAIYYSE